MYAGLTFLRGNRDMDSNHPRLLTAEELAEALAVSLSTIRRMTRDGDLPVVRVRTLVRYEFDDVKVRLAADHSSSSLSS